MGALPSHKQLLLPVLQAVESLGGSASPRDVVDLVAEELQLPKEIRHYHGEVSGREINLFARRVRWVRQDAIKRGFLTAAAYGRWELTTPGKNFLGNIRPGLVITIFETELGESLWAEAESAAAVIAPASVDLILSSPPFPLIKEKHYGNRTGTQYLDWLIELASQWKPLLVDTGSLVLNVGPVWRRGEPTQSIYQERLLLRLVDELGFHLAQRFYFHNPSKIPSSEWVTIRRVRVRNVIEDIWWLSKTPHPKANNRKVLQAYSPRMLKLIATGGEHGRERPSGHGGTQGGFRQDNGGSLPSNLITATNSASNGYYHRECRKHDLPIHPARWAPKVCEFFIQFLTDPGDLVADFLSGSNETGKTAEQLKRRWITSERALAYISGSKFNFPNYTNTAPHLCPI
jgi:site-specific DNA-methyltransferase (cytosine-N4-specific)